jgi:uncharacterized protein
VTAKRVAARAAAQPRLYAWSIAETRGFDAAWVVLGPDRLDADGEAIGQRPGAYSIQYRLETGPDWTTRRLIVECRTAARAETLELRNDDGVWTVDGVVRPDLDGALDCDLAGCPLTNTMPIRRHLLHRTPCDVRFLMAFVDVPSLRVIPHEQRYTTKRVASATGPAVVRYHSAGFTSDLQVDDDGVVLVYPKLGRRILPGVSAARAG